MGTLAGGEELVIQYSEVVYQSLLLMALWALLLEGAKRNCTADHWLYSQVLQPTELTYSLINGIFLLKRTITIPLLSKNYSLSGRPCQYNSLYMHLTSPNVFSGACCYEPSSHL